MFVVGKTYTRADIHKEVGGSVQSYLPTVNGQIVCACLSKKMNPNAPYEILVGNKPLVMKSATNLSEQKTPIPVFIKEASNEWAYTGNFTVVKATHKYEGLERFNLGGREDIQFVLELDNTINIHSSYSWQILSKSVALKQSDKSVFLHHGTGIPKDIRSFFGIENQKEGQKKQIFLMHTGNEYDADLVLSNGRTRLLWKSDFSNILRQAFPQIYNELYENDSTKIKLPKLRFSLHPTRQSSFFIEFLDDKLIEQDVESEMVEEHGLKHEGATKVYYGKRYERIPANRKKAIEIHGTTCKVCGFDFEKVYGDRGRGYIEIHHTKPLSQLKKSYIPDPYTDLIPVCSNCHRMIHRKNDEILSVTQLSDLLKI